MRMVCLLNLRRWKAFSRNVSSSAVPCRLVLCAATFAAGKVEDQGIFETLHTHKYIHTQRHTHTQKDTHTHKYTHTHTNTHTHKDTHTHTQSHTHTHKDTQTHKVTHTHKDTHTHTHTGLLYIPLAVNPTSQTSWDFADKPVESDCLSIRIRVASIFPLTDATCVDKFFTPLRDAIRGWRTLFQFSSEF